MKFSLPDNRLIAYGTIAGALLTAGAMVNAGAVWLVRMRDDATASQAVGTDHEDRIRQVETNLGDIRSDLATVKSDVSWLRLRFDPTHIRRDKPDQVAQP